MNCVDNQIKLRNFLDENNISVYDLVNCAYWRQKQFFEDLFGIRNSEINIIKEIIVFFKNNIYQFEILEENIKNFKYNIISRNKGKYFLTGFESIIRMKSWISELNDISPICLIVNGQYLNIDFKKTIKYDIEMDGE